LIRSSSYQTTKASVDINTMKDRSHASTKPNAWSKPLQGAAPNKAKGINNSGTSSKVTRSAAPPPGYASKPSANSAAVEKTLPALRERFLHLLLTITGQKVTVSLASGVSYTGILHTATPFPHLPDEQRNKYVLRAVTVAGVNGETPAVKPGSTVLLDMDQVIQLHCKACRLDSLVSNATVKAGDTFTDTEISRGANVSQARKDFVAVDATWTSAGDSSTSQPLTPINSKAAKLAGLTSIPANGALKGSIEGWDQFKANEELFNVVGSYDETVYTTILDHSQISAQERLRAEKLAREIENTATSNIHLAEERGQVAAADLADYDEEDRYSGVLKSVSKPKLNYAQAVASAASTLTAEGTTLNDDGINEVDAEELIQEMEIEKDTTAKESHVSTDGSLEHVVNSMEAAHSGEKKDDASIANASELKTPEVKSKLNASAKEFSLNVNAKSFQPTPLQPPPSLPPTQYVYDPVSGMPVMIQPHMIPAGMFFDEDLLV
jgi:LsmAD domain/Ataxin 2 SM domain